MSPNNTTPEEVTICITLLSTWDDRSIPFRVRHNTPMSKIMRTYLSQRKLSDHSVQFIYDGNHLQKKETVESLGMEEGDEILVVTESLGGGLMLVI